LQQRKVAQLGQEVHLILANLVAFHLKEVALKSLEVSLRLKVQAHYHVEKLAL
jgi:hypothetical protein